MSIPVSLAHVGSPDPTGWWDFTHYAFEWWHVTAAANVVMVAVYAGIAFMIIRGLHQGHQWRTNPIGVATAAVFVTCTVGHGEHLLHVLPTVLTGASTESVLAGRAMFSDWRLIAWDSATAVVAAGYWVLRSRLSIVSGGASLCEDMMQRQREAALLQDRVIQGIAASQVQLEKGDRDAGLRTIEETLDGSKTIITTLLGKRGTQAAFGPGDLRREAPSR